MRPFDRPLVRLEDPLCAAVRCGQAEAVRQLLASDAAVDTVDKVRNHSGPGAQDLVEMCAGAYQGRASTFPCRRRRPPTLPLELARECAPVVHHHQSQRYEEFTGQLNRRNGLPVLRTIYYHAVTYGT